IKSGNATAALDTVRQLRQLPEPLGSDPRIDVAEMDAAATLGDYPRLQKAAARAIETASRRGAGLIAARAHSALGLALHRQGRTDEALAEQRRALAIYRETGDRAAIGRALLRIGSVYVYRGSNVDARGYYEKALAVRQGIAENRGIAESRTALATVAIEQGRVDDAVSLAGAAAKWAASAHVRDVETNAHAVLARAFLAQRRVDDAQREADAAEKLITATDDLPLRARVAIISARVALARGNGDDAVRRLTEVSTAMERLVPIRLEADRAGFHLIARPATLRAR